MSELGAVFYRGPSLLTGDPIVAILTGLEGGSSNLKTGPMVQAWILRSDTKPTEAIRANTDDAICGDCALRGRDGKDRRCYVARGPDRIYRSFTEGAYHNATWRELHALLEGRSIRLGAYGDPAAIPFEVWRSLLTTAAGWVSYSHAWRYCDQRLKILCMASVDTVEEFYQARTLGWRTFRIRRTVDEALLNGTRPSITVGQADVFPLEFVCPASDEGNHKSTCQECQLCRGTSSPARNVVIVAHGKPTVLKAFGLETTFFHRRDGQPIMKVCGRCGDDFAAAGSERLCAVCRETPNVVSQEPPRQLCAGGCGRMLLAGRPDARCPDCILARRRERGRDLPEERRRQADAEPVEHELLRSKHFQPREVSTR